MKMTVETALYGPEKWQCQNNQGLAGSDRPPPATHQQKHARSKPASLALCYHLHSQAAPTTLDPTVPIS